MQMQDLEDLVGVELVVDLQILAEMVMHLPVAAVVEQELLLDH
jgi:hypothetical protein